jgi:hypothetical protein
MNIMGRYRRVWVVYRKELLETLRDRRTLIAMIVVPIVLYPVLMLVLVEALRKETGRRQSERYQVVVPTRAHKDWLLRVLEREESERRGQANPEGTATQEAEGFESGFDSGFRASLRPDQLDIRLAAPNKSLWRLVARQDCHVAMIVEPPPNPDHLDDDVNRVVQFIFTRHAANRHRRKSHAAPVQQPVDRQPGAAVRQDPRHGRAVSPGHHDHHRGDVPRH